MSESDLKKGSSNLTILVFPLIGGCLLFLSVILLPCLWIYHRLTRIEALSIEHGIDIVRQTPNRFSSHTLDTRPYLMEHFQDVTFLSRLIRGKKQVNLNGWWIPAENRKQQRTVIIVHGVTSCKRASYALLAAGMLQRSGLNVLLFDLRNHGNSERDNGRQMAGGKEYLDILGAWDWLQTQQHISSKSIGLMGFSMGAAAVTIALGEEDRIAAAWCDSGYGEITEVVKDELRRVGWPAFCGKLTPILGRIVAMENLLEKNPLRSLEKLHKRPYFLVHGSNDKRVLPKHAEHIRAHLDQLQQYQIEHWFASGSSHVNAIMDHPVEYEGKLINFFKKNLGEF